MFEIFFQVTYMHTYVCECSMSNFNLTVILFNVDVGCRQ